MPCYYLFKTDFRMYRNKYIYINIYFILEYKRKDKE